MSRKPIWRRPIADVVPEARHVTASREPRKRREEHGRDRDREDPLREHVDAEGGVDRSAARAAGSISRDANSVSTTALKLIRPRPSVTGSMSTNTCFTAGSRQSRTTRSRPSRPRSHGTGSSTWMTVADQDRDGVDVELCVDGLRLRHAEDEPGDDREVPRDRRQGGHRELLVAVQDPDDHAGQPE